MLIVFANIPHADMDVVGIELAFALKLSIIAESCCVLPLFSAKEYRGVLKEKTTCPPQRKIPQTRFDESPFDRHRHG
jgi:hypothetical protein